MMLKRSLGTTVFAMMLLALFVSKAVCEEKWIDLKYKKRYFSDYYSRQTTAFGVENSEAVFPWVLEADYSRIAQMIEQGQIRRAWYGINCLPNEEFPPVTTGQPAKIEIRSGDSSRMYSTQFAPYEAGFISLMFELPDGSRAGPHIVPNDAWIAPALPDQCRRSFLGWPSGAQVICKRLVKGVEFSLTKGSSPHCVNLTVVNDGLYDLRDASFSLRLGEADPPFFRIGGTNVLYLPVGAAVAFSDILWPPLLVQREEYDDNGKLVEPLIIEWWVEKENITRLSPLISVDGTTCDPSQFHDLRDFGISASVHSREWIGHGHEIVVMKLTNGTGRRILDFESILDTRTPSGKLLARAPSTNVIERDALDWRHDGVIYMRYHLRNANRLPGDAHFSVRFRNIHTDPPMTLDSSSAL